MSKITPDPDAQSYSLEEIFRVRGSEGVFGDKGYKETFYDGLAEAILKDYRELDFLDDYKKRVSDDPSGTYDNNRLIKDIGANVARLWKDEYRKYTPEEVQFTFQKGTNPLYMNLMQNGTQSHSIMDDDEVHSSEVIITLVTAYNMSKRIENMMQKINHSFTLENPQNE